MSQPNPHAEQDEYDFKLHLKAGLQYVGKNEEGQNEFIGTTKQWKDYELMSNEEPQEDPVF